MLPVTTQERLRAIDMHRKRTLEKYEEVLNLGMEQYAIDTLKRTGSFTWYDLCCGEFKAGSDLGKIISEKGLESLVTLRGVDIDAPTALTSSGHNTWIYQGDVIDFKFQEKPDLITEVQGLRYLGLPQRKKAIAHWFNSLSEDGLLCFDYFNGMVLTPEGDLRKYLKNHFPENTTIIPIKQDSPYLNEHPIYFSIQLRKKGSETLHIE